VGPLTHFGKYHTRGGRMIESCFVDLSFVCVQTERLATCVFLASHVESSLNLSITLATPSPPLLRNKRWTPLYLTISRNHFKEGKQNKGTGKEKSRELATSSLDN
jgi:hypothetical protein